jgi:flagellar motor protein MotB
MSDDKSHGGGGHGDAHEGKGHKSHAPHGAHPEHEHEEGWIVGFADNVLLQMGFFVILLAMNIGPKGSGDPNSSDTAGGAKASAEARVQDFAIAMREAFNNPLPSWSNDPETQALIKRKMEREKKGDGGGKDEQENSVRPSDWGASGGYVSFAAESAELSKDEADNAALLAEKFRGQRFIIELRGHSSRLESFGDDARARELSFQRSMAVAKVMVEHGIPWRTLRVVAAGDDDGVVARARSESDHATNQRVEVIVLNETAPPDPFAGEQGN